MDTVLFLHVVRAGDLPRWIGIDPRWGIAGLTATAGLAGWIEFQLLRRGTFGLFDRLSHLSSS